MLINQLLVCNAVGYFFPVSETCTTSIEKYDSDVKKSTHLNACNLCVVDSKNKCPLINFSGMPELDEYTMERVMEEFEQRCYDNMNHAIETEEGLGIEYDEDVVCDVCQSPDGEDGNEMVFCDKCNICVHQVQLHIEIRLCSLTMAMRKLWLFHMPPKSLMIVE